MRVLLSWLLAGLSLLNPAQAAPREEPRFESVGDASQITDGIVTSLAQDPKGFLWLGGASGLLRYDGYQLRSFRLAPQQGLSNPMVRSVLAARDGHVWVASDGLGLARLDPATAQWQVFEPQRARPDAPRAPSVRALAEDSQGGIWLGTLGAGVQRLEPGQGRLSAYRKDQGLPDDRVQSLLVDRRGDIWVGTWMGLARCARGATSCTPAFAAEDSLGRQVVTMLGQLPDGRLWAGTRDGGLFEIDADGQQGHWLERRGEGTVFTLQAQDADVIWLGRASGLQLRDARDGRVLRHLRRDSRQPWSLGTNEVVTLLRDRAGWLWLGSYGGGLQRYNPGNPGLWVRRAEEADASVLREADVRAILPLRQGGRIWLGSNQGGIAIVDESLALQDQIRPAASGQPGLPQGAVGAMAQDGEGRVWVGIAHQLASLDAQGRFLGLHPVGPGRIRRLLADPEGWLWIGTQDGLYRLNTRERQPTVERLVRADGQPLQGNVNALARQADGLLWVGADAGLLRLRPGQERLESLPQPAREALPTMAVLGLLLDREQRLWVDMNAGLYRLRADAEAAPRFEAVAQAHGFAGHEFGANLLQDEQGRLWSHRGMFDPRDGSHYTLTPADGADIGTGWFRSYAQLADGRMLFGGSNGVLVVDPPHFRRWNDQPPVVITELRVDGQPTALPQGPLVLQPRQRNFTVEFAALDFSAPLRNRYRYQLEGDSSGWTESDAAMRVISWGNLPPGDYRLRLQGSNRTGAWSSQELVLPIQVRPAWWQTWWARLAALAALAGLVWALVALRTRMLARRQRELEQRVQERTAELEAMSRSLQEASLTDPLTGLRNRRFLTQHIEADLSLSQRRYQEARRRGQPAPTESDLIFLLLDVDHFKQINDRRGHAAGDAVLRQLGPRLAKVLREVDYLVRWGGEEFLVVARGTTRSQGPELAERLRAAVADDPFELPYGQPLAVSCSVGFACYPLDPQHPGDLPWDVALNLADASLYDAKRRGRNAWSGVVRVDAERTTAGTAAWLADPGNGMLRSGR